MREVVRKLKWDLKVLQKGFNSISNALSRRVKCVSIKSRDVLQRVLMYFLGVLGKLHTIFLGCFKEVARVF